MLTLIGVVLVYSVQAILFVSSRFFGFDHVSANSEFRRYLGVRTKGWVSL
jgi:hypothetical protein